jgi:hypothetical protein
MSPASSLGDSGPRLEPVPRVARLAVEAFRTHHLQARAPVVIEGSIRSWPALRSWSAERLSARFGHRRVSAYEMDEGRIRLDPRAGFRVTELALGAFAERLRSERGRGLFVREPLPGRLPELLGEIATPPHCALGSGLRRNLWWSAESVVTRCHFDLPDNLIACVQGRKRFVLFPPSEGGNLYRHPLWSSVPHLARVDHEHVDATRFPRFARARGWSAELSPGDLLFVPARFWHGARALEETITVNFWFSSPITAALLAVSDAYKRLRSLSI